MVCTSIRIGDKVRSYDFGNRDLYGERACYVEGTVVAFNVLEGCKRYAIKVESATWGGKDDVKRVGQMVYPPVNGTPSSFGGVTDFVDPIYTVEKD